MKQKSGFATLIVILTMLFGSSTIAKELDIRANGDWYKGFTTHSGCWFAGGCESFDANCNGNDVLVSKSDLDTLNAIYYSGKEVVVWDTASSSKMCAYQQ